MGDTPNPPDYPRGVTFEQVWAALMETDRLVKENARELNEAQTRTEAAIAETQKTLNKAIGGLSNTVGNITESLLVHNLVKKFKKLGFTFQVMNLHRKITDDDNNIYAEVDAFLENGEQAMAVEAKTTCRREDVDDHIERMEKIRRHADAHKDNRSFIGAIAAAVIDRDTRHYALRHGFYLIEPAGEDITIQQPEVEKRW